MNIAAIDRVETSSNPDAGVELAQFSSRTSALFLLGLALPATVALLTPFALIGTNPDAVATLIERPGTAAMLGVGLVVAALALIYCLRAGCERLSGRRLVSIHAGRITVEERGLFGVRRWTQPIASYAGVAHHIRASLSGTRHEIVLVHEKPGHDVLLGVSPRAPVTSATEVARQLSLPEIEAKQIYKRVRPLPQPGTVDERKAA